MKEIKITMLEITEITETMQVTDEEFEAIKKKEVGIYPNRNHVSDKLWDMSEMNDYDYNYLDYEIQDGNGNVLDPFEYV